MDATSTSTVCDRIDAAIARIEAALSTRTPGADLQRRHEALREAATNSLAMIEALITAQEAGEGSGR